MYLCLYLLKNHLHHQYCSALATINLTLYKKKQKKDGSIPIYIRITKDRKSRYKSTGISILPKQWNADRQEIRKNHPRYRTLNQELQRQLIEAKNKALELETTKAPSLRELKNHIAPNKGSQILQYASEYLEELKADDRVWEHKHFKVLLGNLETFIRDRPLKLASIDTQFLEEFQRFLSNDIDNGPNTVRKKIQRFRGMVKKARREKLITGDPFLDFELIEKKTVKKDRLNIDQINTIQDLDLETGSSLWHTRNYFMYSFYNAGIRFGDLCCLTWDNLVDNRLIYRMNKTGGLKNIKQLPAMHEILEHYRGQSAGTNNFIFPILDPDKDYSDPFELRRAISSKNVMTNKRLKKIAKRAKIDANLSFHIARHSFASHALQKDMNMYSISKALGHSSLDITEDYLNSFEEEKLDKDMDRLFHG